VLVWLHAIGVDELAEVLDDAWACRAPRRMIAERSAG